MKRQENNHLWLEYPDYTNEPNKKFIRDFDYIGYLFSKSVKASITLKLCLEVNLVSKIAYLFNYNNLIGLPKNLGDICQLKKYPVIKVGVYDENFNTVFFSKSFFAPACSPYLIFEIIRSAAFQGCKERGIRIKIINL